MLRWLWLVASLKAISLNAQQAKVWVLGNREGLDFTQYPPVYFFNATGPGTGAKGASVTDAGGNLLFYSQDDSIWNRNNQVIAGSDFYRSTKIKITSKNGGYGMCAPHVIVPFPNDTNKYYLFDAARRRDSLNDPATGDKCLEVTVIDMQKDNGLGAQVNPWSCVSQESFLELAVTPGLNGNSYWLVCKKVDSLYAFFIDSTGIHNPIVSAAPDLYGCRSGDPKIVFPSLWGTMRFNTKGDRMLSASGGKGFGNRNYMNCFVMYLFDQTKGRFSVDWIDTSDGVPNSCYSGFGVSGHATFLPGDSLFITYLQQLTNTWQYVFTIRRINGDTVQSAKLKSVPAYDILVCPNGQLLCYPVDPCQFSLVDYRHLDDAHVTYLSEYYCNISRSVRAMSSPTVLPNYINNLRFCSFNSDKLPCRKGEVEFTNTSDTVYTQFMWYFGDGDSLLVNGRNTVYHSYKAPGKYGVLLKGVTKRGCPNFSADSLSLDSTLWPVTALVTHASGQGCQFMRTQFQAHVFQDYHTTMDSFRYAWDYGDGTQQGMQAGILGPLNTLESSHRYTKSGQYTVKLIIQDSHCFDTVSLALPLDILPAPDPSFTVSDTEGCSPFQVNFAKRDTARVVQLMLDWGDGNTVTRNSNQPVIWSSLIDTSLFHHIYQQPGMYFISLHLMGETGCMPSDTVSVLIHQGLMPSDSPLVESISWQNNPPSWDIKWTGIQRALGYRLDMSWDSTSWKTHYVGPNTSVLFPADNLQPTFQLMLMDSCQVFGQPSNKYAPALLIHPQIKEDGIHLWWRPGKGWSDLQYQPQWLDSSSGNWLPVSDWTTDTFALHNQEHPFIWAGTSYRVVMKSGALGNPMNENEKVVLPTPTIWVPNAFRPDGVNKLWQISAWGISTIRIQVFNRWGEMVFETCDVHQPWDGMINGQPAPAGVYAYCIDSTAPGTQLNRFGTISLIR